MRELDDAIREWLELLTEKGTVTAADAAELEDHLRSEIDRLEAIGLTSEEAALVGIHRLGTNSDLSREFRKVNGNFIWKQLTLGEGAGEPSALRRIGTVILLSLVAGSLAKVPELFGVIPFHGPLPGQIAYLRTLAIFFMLPAAGYFLVTRGVGLLRSLVILGLMGLTALPVNLFPLLPPDQSAVMVALHLPVLLWLGVGLAYGGVRWREHTTWLDFIRYSGEVFIYTVLILLGGGVLTGVTLLIFQTIGTDLRALAQQTIVIYGAMAAPIVAIYLVDAKKGVIENIAPVLSRIFSPLFLLILIVYLVAMIVLGASPFTDRGSLVVFDGLLLIVLGLAVFAISARSERAPIGLPDLVTFALVVAALVADGVALSAILFRLAEYGVSVNKIVVLGDNLLFLVNLAGIGLLYLAVLLGRRPFRAVVRYQTLLVPVYALWAAIVAFGIPPLFGFR